MPIGVPRIIYSWGEELPAQWTDIYNFIFRRRMVFLMQYLDDELCNQICGLLINIHMEDRSKDLEKKDMEQSGLFKNAKTQRGDPEINATQLSSEGKKKEKSIEDLMISEEDLDIDENHKLERHTLQKISLEWLNWNSQFFDYSDEPYLFYLAELLSNDFNSNEGHLLYNSSLDSFKSGSSGSDTWAPMMGGAQMPLSGGHGHRAELSKLMNLFKNMTHNSSLGGLQPDGQPDTGKKKNFFDGAVNSNTPFDIYSAFRLLSNFTEMNYNNFQFNNTSGGGTGRPKLNKENLIKQFEQLKKQRQNQEKKNSNISNFTSDFAQKEFLENMDTEKTQWNSSEKAFAQRELKRSYREKGSPLMKGFDKKSSSFSFGRENRGRQYLSNQFALTTSDRSAFMGDEAYLEYKDYYRKQTEQTFQDEETKKVFMIINSFGGSVGNGITIHDALQFIKAGSMTLGLGVAASAASLALAGGTIGERYVTEGCHCMIHQPESSLSGQASDIWIDSQEIMKIRLDVAEIYSLSTYRPRHKILRDLDRDFYLTATETIYYGLADEIATNEVMHSIIEMTNKVWDYHDGQQQRLLESRDSATSGLDTQTQN
jgi:ATP-dependent Clp protease protease subunit